MDRVYLNGSDLTFEQIWSIAYQMTEVSLTDEAAQNVKVCREYVDRIIREGRVVYGLTTGFGKFSTISIPADQIDELQENLILSHATGVGPFLSISETRAILLLRINVLARGHSGIRLETLQALIDMLNAGTQAVEKSATPHLGGNIDILA